MNNILLSISFWYYYYYCIRTSIFYVYGFEFYSVVLISNLMCSVLFFVQLLNSNSHQIMPHTQTPKLIV